MKKVLFLFFLTVHTAVGQVVLENNPTGLKWRQIRTPNFRVIFPAGFDFQAQRVASTLERIRSSESRSMGTEPRKISVVLQNQSSISNGFVSMFPRRSEFFTMPSQNYNFIGSNDWLNLLASHEYRHIVQYQQASRGFNKLLFYLFGGPTMAGMAHAAAPDWFWEGDAVATETAFTPSGRGRIPYFNLIFRTNLLEGRAFNYHKQYLRSYKHNIPNHYVLGYNLVSYLRRRTNDPDIWEKITARSWNIPFIPFAFSNAIRRETGMSVTKLYREMANDLRTEWQDEINNLVLTPYETISQRKTKAYTDYLYPQPQSDGSVIAMKDGIGEIEKFVRITHDREEVIFTPGFMNDAGLLSTGNKVIAWNEFGYDPRWQVRNYSQIKAFDWEHGLKVVVTGKKARYGSAAISPDGKQIATVRSDENYNHSLIVLSYPSGQTEIEFPNPENFFFAMPRWSSDGKKLCALKITDKGKTVTLIDPADKSQQDLFPVSHENIGHPFMAGEFLLYSSSVSGIDNLYALNISSGKKVQVTSSKYGAYNPVVSPDGKFIYYNEQTRDGFDIARVPFDPSQWKEYKSAEPLHDLYSHLVEQEGEPLLFENIPPGNYPVSNFSKLRHMINPFSWGFLVQNDLARVDVGISSQDILSTASLTAGYTFDLTERTGLWRAGLSYQGFYPIFDLGFSRGERSIDEEYGKTVITGDQVVSTMENYTITWSEQNMEAGIRLPLNLTRSKFASGLEASYSVGLTKVTDFNNGLNDSRLLPALIRDGELERVHFLIDYASEGSLLYNSASLSGYRLMKRSRRDIYSKWGQVFNLQYYGTPFGGDFEGGVLSATGFMYFPGLFRHHSLNGYVAYQETMIPEDLRINNYLFRNTIPFPRGINDYVSRHRRFLSASLNYAFPLWYPDIAIGPVLNVQRVRMNLFGDVASAESAIFQYTNSQYISVGGELVFDINVLRFLPQLDLGVRYSYGIDPSITKFELLIGTFNF
jgi:hypothetical protein